MTYGVIIDGVNTKTAYDLIVLADITESAPKLKEVYQDIPNGDGALNFSFFNGAHYENRNVSFTLFAPVPDDDLADLREELMAAYHGKIVELTLPTDTTRHYRGVMQIGDFVGYNTGKIPVSMVAEPWRYANTETEVTQTGDGTVTLANDRMPVNPVIESTATAELTWNGNTATIDAGEGIIIPSLVLDSASLSIDIVTTGTVTFTYTKGAL